MSTPRHRGPLAVVRPVEEIWGDYNRISDDSQNKARGEAAFDPTKIKIVWRGEVG
jgi:hypothetical protein